MIMKFEKFLMSFFLSNFDVIDYFAVINNPLSNATLQKLIL